MQNLQTPALRCDAQGGIVHPVQSGFQMRRTPISCRVVSVSSRTPPSFSVVYWLRPRSAGK
eukprot:11928989-Heterocapsa_arctica.AAC.1